MTDYTRRDWNADVRRGFLTVHDGEGREVRLPIVPSPYMDDPPLQRMFLKNFQAPHKRTVTEDSSPVLKWRVERGFNQVQAGDALGVKYGVISEWERGVREIPARVLEIIGGTSNG